MAQKLSFYKIAFLLSLLNVAASATSTHKPIQDNQAAAQYFQHELDFKTNPMGVKAVLEGKVKNVIIVDVRAKKDYDAVHIEGAINIPYDEHKGFSGDETEFAGLTKDGFNYVYCYKLLCNLSAKACQKFASLGYPVKEIQGGFQSWVDHNFPVVK